MATPRARAVLEEYDVNPAELVDAWMAQEEGEVLMLTRGETTVVLVCEAGGILHLLTFQDLRNAAL